MSNAPDRIWAEIDGDKIIIHNGANNLDSLIGTGYLDEYIHADILAKADELAKAGDLQWTVFGACPELIAALTAYSQVRGEK